MRIEIKVKFKNKEDEYDKKIMDVLTYEPMRPTAIFVKNPEEFGSISKIEKALSRLIKEGKVIKDGTGYKRAHSTLRQYNTAPQNSYENEYDKKVLEVLTYEPMTAIAVFAHNVEAFGNTHKTISSLERLVYEGKAKQVKLYDGKTGYYLA